MPTSGEAHLRRLVTDASTSGDWDRAREMVVPQIESGTTGEEQRRPEQDINGDHGGLLYSSGYDSFVRKFFIGQVSVGKFFGHCPI